MAEGWTRHLKCEHIEAFSAGTEAHGLNPMAVKTMAEAGVDISKQKSKTIDTLNDRHFDYVITMCDQARRQCPVFPARVPHVHVAFDDPPQLARGAKTEAEVLDLYRRVRDEIRRYIESLPKALTES
jgi:arsenate reductase (thioredoxin)